MLEIKVAPTIDLVKKHKYEIILSFVKRVYRRAPRVV